MKRRKQSTISEIFDLFIFYKIFEIIISIAILVVTYKLFPTPFNFFYDKILQHIK